MRRRIHLRVILSFLAACFFAHGECIGPKTPCEAFERANHVFVGTVLEVNILESIEELGPIRVNIRMRVDHVFKGFPNKGRREISFEQVFSETWINPEGGERYLVFSRRDDAQLLDLCQGTYEVHNSYDLSHIEALSQGRTPWAVAGVVRDRADPGRGIPDADFHIEGPPQFDGHTTANGTFLLPDVPPGTYSLSFSHPDYYWSSEWRKGVKVDRSGCAYATVSLDPNNSIQGRLLDADGRPVANASMGLRGLPSAWGKYPPGSTARSGEDGTFIFRGILPGPYILEVPYLKTLGKDGLTAQDVVNNPTAYHPGTFDKTTASVVRVDRDTKGNVGDFRLPAIR